LNIENEQSAGVDLLGAAKQEHPAFSHLFLVGWRGRMPYD
jgi:hypothetical protein